MNAQQIIFENLVTNYILLELYIRNLHDKFNSCNEEERPGYKNEINVLREMQVSHRNLIFKTLDRIYTSGSKILVKNERMESTMAAYFCHMEKIFPIINIGKSRLSPEFQAAIKEDDILKLNPIAKEYF